MVIPVRQWALVASALWALSPSATAATATSQFNVQIVVTAECLITSVPTLSFGATGVISGPVDASSSLVVLCTNGTPYTVAIDEGAGSGATVASRRMTGPSSQTVQYSLYRDSARTQLWGKTTGTDTLSGTGNSLAQTIPVYGRVPAQATPGAGAYVDTVTVTVTY